MKEQIGMGGALHNAFDGHVYSSYIFVFVVAW